MKLSALVLAFGMAFSGSSFAASNVWNSTVPWAAATTAQYAEWNAFDAVSIEDNTPAVDTTPNIALSANTTASLAETSNGLSGAFVTGGLQGNIYSFSGATQFAGTLSGSTGGFYDVYLRVATIGNFASSIATLNGQQATSTVTFSGGSGQNIEQELYWVWTGVAGSNLYTFNFNASTSSMSLDQLALATTVSAVPEPEAYGMMAMGLGLLALARRRDSKNKA